MNHHGNFKPCFRPCARQPNWEAHAVVFLDSSDSETHGATLTVGVFMLVGVPMLNRKRSFEVAKRPPVLPRSAALAVQPVDGTVYGHVDVLRYPQLECHRPISSLPLHRPFDRLASLRWHQYQFLTGARQPNVELPRYIATARTLEVAELLRARIGQVGE